MATVGEKTTAGTQGTGTTKQARSGSARIGMTVPRVFSTEGVKPVRPGRPGIAGPPRSRTNEDA